jgi:hypothetical protein
MDTLTFFNSLEDYIEIIRFEMKNFLFQYFSLPSVYCEKYVVEENKKLLCHLSGKYINKDLLESTLDLYIQINYVYGSYELKYKCEFLDHRCYGFLIVSEESNVKNGLQEFKNQIFDKFNSLAVDFIISEDAL